MSYHNGDFDQAISDFTKYLQSKPKSDFVLLIRGQAYYKKDNYDLAISDFNKVIELGRYNYFAYVNLAFTYFKTKNYEKSSEYAHKAERDEAVSHPNTSQSTLPLGPNSQVLDELKKLK